MPKSTTVKETGQKPKTTVLLSRNELLGDYAANDLAKMWYALQHKIILIIFPPILQTILKFGIPERRCVNLILTTTVADMLSTKGTGLHFLI